MKVIIATDGSETGNKVADYGVRFAAKLGAAVYGIYVINPKTVELRAAEHNDISPGHAKEIDMARKAGEAALAGLASRCRAAGLEVSTDILQGDPAEEIIRLAGEEKADMIVVGNVSKTNIEYMYMGSVSESVVRKSPCPVLVIRGDMRV
ncbi:MAG: Universal stress protein [Methanocella sp. PtaU1.Bin125]|nr:MAG: Universal stress protein [Methanocella sp. PtaU1.Bin125]